jgi:hypothetical protein
MNIDTRYKIMKSEKNHLKDVFDHQFHPHSFSEEGLVLSYDISYDSLGDRKFKSIW